MGLSTRVWGSTLVACVFGALALLLLRDGLRPDHVLVSGESLERSLPWSAVLDDLPRHNRFVGDQPRIFYPYLRQAAAVYRGEADALWTTRGGGGLPFLANMTSALFHPLTWLVAALPVEVVPLVAGLLVLWLSALFTFLFLRRLGLRLVPSAFGALAFGFGGHQVLWLQYALSHTLLALPVCFWAVERVVEDRSRRRVAVLALAFALLVVGGHPETALVAGLVAATWAFYRLWDAHGRSLVVWAGLLALALSAAQWLPFLEYARASHGLVLRRLEAERDATGVTLGAALVFAFFFLLALATLRACSQRGLMRRVAAVAAGAVAVVMARRLGMSVSALTVVLPDMYGSPVGGGVFTGAQDYPGLNAGFVGALPALLLAVGAVVGRGGGRLRFFAVAAFLLWGAAHHMPAVEGLVRALPGLSEVQPTRLLGPVGFAVACGGAIVLDLLTAPTIAAAELATAGRVAINLVLVLVASLLALAAPIDPHGGREIVNNLIVPVSARNLVHDGHEPVTIAFEMDGPADDLRVMVDRRVLRSGAWPPPGLPATNPVLVRYDAQRAEEGRHRLVVEVERGGVPETLADQPLAIRRARQLAPRDCLFLGLALAVLGLLVLAPGARTAALACALAGADVALFGEGYNVATPAERLYPRTATVDFLQAQPGPFRVFAEGNILPPDTQFAVGLDHLMSYDNIGYHRTAQWLMQVLDLDAFATFSFGRQNVAYGHPIFDTLDVGYVLTDRSADLSSLPGLALVHESETRVWSNADNLGRAFVVGQAMDLDKDDVAALAQADPREVALLESPPPLELGGRGTARVREHQGRRVVVEVECEGPALLVLSENRAPGWVAAVDGGPESPTLPCDVAFQAVPVPAGRHEVVFRYAPASWRWGQALSAIAGALVLACLVLPRHLR